jgi:hypothetical protein
MSPYIGSISQKTSTKLFSNKERKPIASANKVFGFVCQAKLLQQSAIQSDNGCSLIVLLLVIVWLSHKDRFHREWLV